jgi:hypothetical protein
MKLSNIKPNPNNPRLIKDDKFAKLVQSIKDFPEMMEKRPIVCVTDVDGKIYPLGGNMRYKAIKELGYKDVPDTWIVMADEWTEEKRREFVVKDNVGFGEWDWGQLQTWDAEQLEAWGLDVPEFAKVDDINLDSFFEENNEQKEQKSKITLEYTQEEYQLVIDAFSKHTGSKEQIVFKLLGL